MMDCNGKSEAGNSRSQKRLHFLSTESILYLFEVFTFRTLGVGVSITKMDAKSYCVQFGVSLTHLT